MDQRARSYDKNYFPYDLVVDRPSWGPGFILPRPGGGSAELTEHRFPADLVDQVVKSKSPKSSIILPLTAARRGFIISIPQEAIINQFALYVDGKKLAGELLDRDHRRAPL